MSNQNLNNESFKNSMTTVEKVHYKGELRIVGQIVNSLSDKEPIGYVIMLEKTQQFKPYTVAQTMSLISRFKFVNAAIENGKIVNTECSMQRMPKFDSRLTVIGNFGIIVLGEITDGNSKIGYRVMDTTAKIVDLTEVELLNASVNRGIEILNAKVVTRNSKPSVSAIKQEFTKIEKSKIPQAKKRITEQARFRYEQHNEKLMEVSIPRLLRKLFINPNWDYITITDELYWRPVEKDLRRVKPGALEVEKEFEIFCKELATSKYSCELSDKDRALIKRISTLIPYQKQVLSSERVSIDTKMFLVCIFQFALNNKEVYNTVLKRLKGDTNRIKTGLVKDLIEKNLACESLINLYKDLIKHLRESAEAHEAFMAKELAKCFTTSTFINGEDIAQLGFTINSSNKGLSYKTKAGFTKTLLYLGDIIKDDYDTYKNQCRCFGDLASIAYLCKIFDLLDSRAIYGLNRDSLLDCATIIVTLSYIFGNKAMKQYVDNNIDKFDEYGIEIPDFAELSTTDYKLDKALVMYYSSGFNVFLNDNQYKKAKYKRIYLQKGELINYRQVGLTHDIAHPLITDELASVVNLVSPDTLSSEAVTKFIGRIRFL